MSEPQPSTSRARSIVSFPSPKKKRTKKGPLSSSEKQILINVYKFVEETWPKDCYPYKRDIVEKTSEIMGMSVPTVYSVIKEYKTTHKVVSPPLPATKPNIVDSLDDMDLASIRRIVRKYYFDNEMPTIDKIVKSVNDDDSLPNFKRDVMCKILKKLGFKYSKRNRQSMLLDKPTIAIWRINYLNDMAKYRKEGRKIYYLDETWVNEGHAKSLIWKDTTITSHKEAHRQGLSTGLKNPSGKGKRLILGHIGSSNGFLVGAELIFQDTKGDGDYHSEMDSHKFEEWFSNFLPKLEKNSVVVMDNAPYHSRKREKVPTTASRKAEIQQWLNEKNIDYNKYEVKAQLLQKVNQVRCKYQTYAVEELAKEYGITVLRLPPYHCELNPIELIWAQIKGYVAQKNKTFKMSELKNLLPEAIAHIREENWRNCEDHVIKEEQKMLLMDRMIDETTDRFIIHVASSSSSSSSSDTD